jgi:hypothetical protein
MGTYAKPKANEWVQPVRRDYKMACCDCGLVHNLDFRIVDGRVQFRVRRNNRSTAMVRRHRRIRVKTT